MTTNKNYGIDFELECLAIDGTEFRRFMEENTGLEYYVVDRFSASVIEDVEEVMKENESLDAECGKLEEENEFLRRTIDDARAVLEHSDTLTKDDIRQIAEMLTYGGKE